MRCGAAAWFWRVAALVAHLLYLAPPPVAWHGLAALFLLSLPGGLLPFPPFRAEADALSPGFLALRGGIAQQVLLLLALQGAARPASWWLVLLAFDPSQFVAGMAGHPPASRRPAYHCRRRRWPSPWR